LPPAVALADQHHARCIRLDAVASSQTHERRQVNADT
jgi:hypothetical protein